MVSAIEANGSAITQPMLRRHVAGREDFHPGVYPLLVIDHLVFSFTSDPAKRARWRPCYRLDGLHVLGDDA